MESLFDVLEVFDGQTANASSIIATLTGNKTPKPILTSGNEAMLRFTSDGTVTLPGFLCNFEGDHFDLNQMKMYLNQR